MTDKLHYQDVFTTINIPKPERRLALKAKNLLDVASGVAPWDPNVFTHLSKTTDSAEASQAFWAFENEELHTFDRLVLSIVRRGFIVALEHRDFERRDRDTRKSLVIEQGSSKVYNSTYRRFEMGSTSKESIGLFKTHFFETTASLGLLSQTAKKTESQSESRSATLANAA